jgi:hypothetical protein
VNGLSAAGDQLWTRSSASVLGAAAANDGFGSALAAGDFDGDGFDDMAVGVADDAVGDFDKDGFDDLAIGAAFEAVGATLAAGSVNVLHGSLAGLTAADDQLWSRDSAGVLGAAAQPDQFGSALAVGDFDGDGFDDLAVGARLEDLTGISSNDGIVHVFYGSAAGLTAAGDQLFSQDTGTIPGVAGADDTFGTALAAADFSGDGVDDLAIGVPEEDIGAAADAGAVHVLFGIAGTGLSDAGNQYFDQDTGTIADTAEQSDLFADALSAGDMNGDGIADLAVGAQGEDSGADSDTGAVSVIYGSVGGLTEAGNQYFDQDEPGIEDAAEPADLLGEALAIGDMNGDGIDDLAAGAIQEEVGGTDAGGVSVIYGSAGAGLTAIGDQFYSQDTAGIQDTPELFDAFGASLVSYDADGDGAYELAIGVPGEERVVGAPDHGIFQAIRGIPGVGLTDADRRWGQNTNGIQETAESSDQLATSLSAGDFDGDGFDDVAAGASHEGLIRPGVAAFGAGGVNVLYGGSPGGLSGAGDQFWSQDTAGIKNQSNQSEHFGESLPGDSDPN